MSAGAATPPFAPPTLPPDPGAAVAPEDPEDPEDLSATPPSMLPAQPAVTHAAATVRTAATLATQSNPTVRHDTRLDSPGRMEPPDELPGAWSQDAPWGRSTSTHLWTALRQIDQKNDDFLIKKIGVSNYSNFAAVRRERTRSP